MTCIVGMIDDGNVYIGGDSAGVGGYSLSRRADSKVYRNGNFLFGFTSSFRMGQLLRYRFTPPVLDTWDIERYMTTDFVDEVRRVLKEYGFSQSNSGQDIGGTFLVGTKTLDGEPRLFCIQSDFQVGWNCIGFDSCGCGSDIALGSMYALQSSNMSPDAKITVALDAASEFSSGVCGPYVVEKL